MQKFDTAKILDGLNEKQKEAVQTTQGPLLVIAGPGSGKTRVLTHRIAWILGNRIACPDEVLALTFTKKAAEEMRTRVESLLSKDVTRRMWMGTFHSMMVRILRKEGSHIGFTSDFLIYDTDDSERLLKQVMDDEFNTKDMSLKSIHAWISWAKNTGKDGNSLEKSAQSKSEKIAGRFFDEYNEALSKCNAFDFDDLLLKPLELFQKRPDILRKYQDRWSHILIDEYQDTNHVQYRLAYALADRHRNLCIVGDDAQGIYSFRGADIENILSFQKDFKDAKLVRLEQNYRSTKVILGAAGAVIRQNTRQIKKNLWTENPAGSPVTVISAETERDEAQQATGIIQRGRKGRTLRDFAILYRTNIQSRAFEEALFRQHIPYVVIGALSFYQRKVIKDAIAYLRFLMNPNDIASFTRIVNHPMRGIGLSTQQTVLKYARRDGYTLMRALEEIAYLPINPNARNALRAFVTMIRTHADRLEMAWSTADFRMAGDIFACGGAGKDDTGHSAESRESPVDVAASLFREAGIMGIVKTEDIAEPGDNLLHVGAVPELLNGMREYFSEDESHTLGSYLQHVSLLTDADRDRKNRDHVSLMTIHSSKGLEFDTVFIAGLEEGKLPFFRDQEIDTADLEEERRLFYVGITRAKSRLYLGRVKVRYQNGGQLLRTESSRFLEEIQGPSHNTSSSGWRLFRKKPNDGSSPVRYL